MRIENIYIKNFKGIEEADIEAAGKSLYLIGGNATGKTSFIDAVWCGLTGKNLPEAPVTRGNKKGEIRLDLGEFTAVTQFEKNKPAKFSLELNNPGEESDKFIKSPRTYLNNRIGLLEFDIKEFFSKSPAEQVKYFAKISGIDFGDIDDEIKEIEENRLFDGRKLKEYKAKVTYYDKKDVDKEIVSVLAATQELQTINEKATTYIEGQQALNKVNERIEEITDALYKLCCEIYGDANPDQFVIHFPENLTNGLLNKRKAIELWLDDPANKPLTAEEIEAKKAALNTLEQDNKRIQEAKDGKENDDLVEKYEEQIEKYEEELAEARRKKAKRISDNITVEGLTYDMETEGFLYNGLPFDDKQINTAAQLIAGLKIGAMLLKDLKILKVDASLIDKKEFDKVLAWAEDQNIELFVELVDREAGELKIEVHEQ